MSAESPRLASGIQKAVSLSFHITYIYICICISIYTLNLDSMSGERLHASSTALCQSCVP